MIRTDNKIIGRPHPALLLFFFANGALATIAAQLSCTSVRIRQLDLATVSRRPRSSESSCCWSEGASSQRVLRWSERVRPNKRLKLAARVDCGMNLSSARRSLSAIR